MTENPHSQLTKKRKISKKQQYIYLILLFVSLSALDFPDLRGSVCRISLHHHLLQAPICLGQHCAFNARILFPKYFSSFPEFKYRLHKISMIFNISHIVISHQLVVKCRELPWTLGALGATFLRLRGNLLASLSQREHLSHRNGSFCSDSATNGQEEMASMSSSPGHFL